MAIKGNSKVERWLLPSEGLKDDRKRPAAPLRHPRPYYDDDSSERGEPLRIKVYQYTSLYVDLLHRICKEKLDRFTSLQYPSREGDRMLLIKLLGT